jgi:hypothetical protein
MWLVAGLTLLSGVVVAARMTETLRRTLADPSAGFDPNRAPRVPLARG